MIRYGGWIEFDGTNMLPPVNVPVLAWWRFNDGRNDECPFAVAVFNGHFWCSPDNDEDDYRNPAYWMQIPSAPAPHTLHDAATGSNT